MLSRQRLSKKRFKSETIQIRSRFKSETDSNQKQIHLFSYLILILFYEKYFKVSWLRRGQTQSENRVDGWSHNVSNHELHSGRQPAHSGRGGDGQRSRLLGYGCCSSYCNDCDGFLCSPTVCVGIGNGTECLLCLHSGHRNGLHVATGFGRCLRRGYRFHSAHRLPCA